MLGYDGFGLEIIRAVLHYNPQWSQDLYNRSLWESCFPLSWKRAVAVSFPIEGNHFNFASSYSTICLLPAAGNLLDNFCWTPLSTHLEASRGVLSNRQLGFLWVHGWVKGTSTKSKGTKNKYICFVALDIKITFIRWTSLFHFSMEYGVDPKPLPWLCPFFRKNIAFNVGGLQRSCLGPILWLGLKSLFQLLLSDGVFAYCVLINISHRAFNRFTDILQTVLEETHSWAKEYSLNFCYDKWQYTVIQPKGKLNYIVPIKIEEIPGQMNWKSNLLRCDH